MIRESLDLESQVTYLGSVSFFEDDKARNNYLEKQYPSYIRDLINQLSKENTSLLYTNTGLLSALTHNNPEFYQRMEDFWLGRKSVLTPDSWMTW